MNRLQGHLTLMSRALHSLSRHVVLQKLFADFLPGKVCVITGGGRGGGQAIAEKYAAEGFTLILTARSKDQLEKVWKKRSLCT